MDTEEKAAKLLNCADKSVFEAILLRNKISNADSRIMCKFYSSRSLTGITGIHTSSSDSSEKGLNALPIR